MEQDRDSIVIPVVEEQIQIDKKEVELGRTRILKRVKRVKRTIDEPAERRAHHVRRVPVDRIVDDVSEPRVEGDTFIIPVYEERLVLEKRLVLVEELHIDRVTEQTRVTGEAELRSEVVEVERMPAPRGKG